MAKPPAPSQTMLPAHWRNPLAAWVALFLALLVVYRHTAAGMVSIWSRSETYAHGFVVPLISLWLIWRIRHRLAGLLPKPHRLSWLLMLGAAALWLAGDLVAVNAATQLALVMLLVLSVPAVLGWPVTKAMAFPLGFLFFAVPLGDFMLPQLMQWTADFTVVALRLSGIPVYREGLQFVIPSGSWSVVQACSGIRYLIASLTVGCLFAYLSYRSLKKRLVFVGVAILVPLVANWLRAYLIVLIGHISGNELATGVDHLIYGWVFFGIVILAMLFIGARWADAPLPDVTAGEPVAQGDGDSTRVSGRASTSGLASMVAALVALLIAMSPHGLEQILSLGNHPGVVKLAPFKAQSSWQAEASPPSGWMPAFKNASAATHYGYLGPDGQRVGVHLSYYRQQDYERKLVSSENVLVNSQDSQWARVDGHRVTTSLAGQPLAVEEALLNRQTAGLTFPTERLLVWRFYWVNGRFTASDALGKIQGALSRLSGHGDDGAIIALYTPLSPDVPVGDAREAASAVLKEFVKSHGAGLEEALAHTREAP